ncbi:ATP-grasp fold amidoligase family protein [Virgibacillus sp. C22-A2]|uniref:ATP-grasp fold amidoligase family protein n=2 Tax=Virgibacillus tibetensis TaxID=3042313 RepID=A0ABU6KKW3_9BACI|nr:ATP-grasp fold amidoligase family protein [Virgibacillus sp. C22-A2]
MNNWEKAKRSNHNLDHSPLGESSNKDKETEELIETLIKKDAEIKKTEIQIRRNKKNIKYMEQSKTWKYSRPLRIITSLFTKLTGRKEEKAQTEYINQLKADLHNTQKELYQTRENLQEMMLDDRKLDSNKVIELVRSAKEDGNLIDYIEKVTQNKEVHDANYIKVLRYAARVFMNDKTEYRNLAYTKVIEGLKIEDIPEFIIRAGLDEKAIPLKQAASFRASLNIRMRQKQLVEPLPEWLLDNKQDAYAFIEKLAVKKPWFSDKKYKMGEIPQQEGIVIKPADGAGSRGVYLVYSFNDIVDIKRSQSLDSWEALKANMEKDIISKWVDEDEWMMEELILESTEEKIPASDVKFYCFYGKVGLILEITRFPELKYCWWTAAGERIRTGKYDEDLFKGKGFTDNELALAADISLNIPAPFIRIDFLRSQHGLVFGEFTPKPGNYDEFDQHTDQWMGDNFIEAQGRLVNDLINRKQFKDYQELIESLDK